MEYAKAKELSCLPLQFDKTPSDLESRTATAIDGFFAVVDRLVQIPKENATFDKAVLPYIRAENEFLRANRHIGFYAGQSPKSELRQASRKASTQFDEAEIRLGQRRDLYELMKNVLDTEKDLDADFLYWLRNIVTCYEKTGLSIQDPEKAERFAAVQKQRTDVTTAIITNLNDEKSGIWLTKEELAGLPTEFIESHRREREGHAEASIWVTFSNPDLVAVSARAESSETRKKHYLANENKLPANVALYRELFLLRDEYARLLGYNSYASFAAQFQELGGLDKVNSFLDGIEARAKAPAESEFAAMLKIKEKWLEERGEADPHPGTLFRWDSSFYMQKLGEQESGIDYKLVDEYFPLDHCLKMCFGYFHRLFGVRIEPVEASDADVWHEEVRMYAMWDDDNEAFLGWLYLDLFPRDGKYNHFGHYGLQPVGLAASGTSLLAASSAIVANFARGTATTPALLPSTVSKRLFHELGHAMHTALSRARCARQHLVVGRYAAYSEAVSILFEQFLWTPEHTRECSLHYSHVGDEYARAWRAAHPEARELPPRQLPAETVSALLARRPGASAVGVRSQILLSRWDLAAYGPASREELADLDLAAAYNRMRTEVTGFAGGEIETGRFDLGHGFANLRLIAGIYAAYYYCYAFSRVWALDMFYTGFKGDTMNKEKGRRYRQIVLERSDSMAPMDILREFLGREPSDEAYFDANGL